MLEFTFDYLSARINDIYDEGMPKKGVQEATNILNAEYALGKAQPFIEIAFDLYPDECSGLMDSIRDKRDKLTDIASTIYDFIKNPGIEIPFC